jgi:hypothetical protein
VVVFVVVGKNKPFIANNSKECFFQIFHIFLKQTQRTTSKRRRPIIYLQCHATL